MPKLVAVSDRIFALEDFLRLMPGFYLPVRTTIIKLENGGLMVISPLAIDDALAREIEAIGPVSYLVAPNCLHHLFLAQAQARWPSATTLAAPGLPKKLPALRYQHLLPAGLPDEVRAVEVQGADKLGEFVLHHPATRTLIVTDLVFNIHALKGFLTPLVLRMVGAYRRLAQSRALRMMTNDRKQAASSAKQIVDLDFDRLVVAHGEIVESQAKPGLRSALSWMLAGAPT